MRRPGRLWVVIAASAAVIVIVVGAVTWWASGRSDDRVWSMLPHTMGCATDTTSRDPAPLRTVNAQQLSVEHLDGQRIAVSVTFASTPPDPPRQVRSPYGGDLIDAPGSLSYIVFITAPHLGKDSGIEILSPVNGSPWYAGMANLSAADHEIPLTVSTSGKVVRLVVDLAGQDRLLDHAPFTPTISVSAAVSIPPTPELIGGDLASFRPQVCTWDTPTKSSLITSALPTAPDSPPAAPSPTSQLSPPGTPAPDCGPNASTALQQALSNMPPDAVTGRGWDPTPVESNFDACADLSTILVTVQGGTGSSPMQALMFHRGTYLGTGTLQAYGFTTIDTAQSTTDTVVLRYRSGQSCTACGDGVVTTVRYRWDGSAVRMLDPPPPSG